MNQGLNNKIANLLIEIADKLKTGTSEISEEDAIDIFKIITHQPISREAVCDMLNINNTKFYELIAIGKIPKGRKRRGFKELVWYKDEIEDAMNKLRNNK